MKQLNNQVDVVTDGNSGTDLRLGEAPKSSLPDAGSKQFNSRLPMM